MNRALAAARAATPLALEISGLTTSFATPQGVVRAVDGIDLELRMGEVLGLVGETGKVLEGILAQVTHINGAITEIAASAQEQATGLHQVNTAVNQMDQVTQQNAAMVEEATAASHALSNEADAWQTLISRFRVGETAANPAAPRAAKPATVTQLKTAGRGGAALRTDPVEEWHEF